MTQLTFKRCEFIQDDFQCENCFPTMGETSQIFCDDHTGATIPAKTAVTSESEDTKKNYLNQRNEQESLCAHMSLEELDKHIANCDMLIEKFRLKSLVARGTRQNKLSALTEVERDARKKIKIQLPASENKPLKPKKITMKENPVGYLMQTLNISRDKAEQMMKMGGI